MRGNDEATHEPTGRRTTRGSASGRGDGRGDGRAEGDAGLQLASRAAGNSVRGHGWMEAASRTGRLAADVSGRAAAASEGWGGRQRRHGGGIGGGTVTMVKLLVNPSKWRPDGLQIGFTYRPRV